jgi:elongation factor Ts
MEITASLVKELRERTGAGMMECKRALTENDGNIEAAIESMRKKGQATAEKKSGRIAAEGLITLLREGNKAAMVEVNCETDFVTKNEDFKQFCQAVVETVLREQPVDLQSLLSANLKNGKNVEENRHELILKIGENIMVRRFAMMEAKDRLGVYLHGVRIGILVDMQGGSDVLAKDVAMHIAASRPICISSDQIPAETIAKEREIFTVQAAETGKPAAIIEKIVQGRLEKFFGEVTLLGQPFVKDPEQLVGKLLKTNQATVLRFERFEVGEGIEKKKEDFASEVMQQVRGC